MSLMTRLSRPRLSIECLEDRYCPSGNFLHTSALSTDGSGSHSGGSTHQDTRTSSPTLSGSSSTSHDGGSTGGHGGSSNSGPSANSGPGGGGSDGHGGSSNSGPSANSGPGGGGNGHNGGGGGDGQATATAFSGRGGAGQEDGIGVTGVTGAVQAGQGDRDDAQALAANGQVGVNLVGPVSDNLATFRLDASDGDRAASPFAIAPGGLVNRSEETPEKVVPPTEASSREELGTDAAVPASDLATRSLAADLTVVEEALKRFLGSMGELIPRLPEFVIESTWRWWYVGGSAGLAAALLAMYCWSREREEQTQLHDVYWLLGSPGSNWPRKGMA
jgi:hypothetical protein